MPQGPNGENRPANVAGCAVPAMRIATGEIKDPGYKQPGKREDGKAVGKALTKGQRKAIAQQGVASRWG